LGVGDGISSARARAETISIVKFSVEAKMATKTISIVKVAAEIGIVTIKNIRRTGSIVRVFKGFKVKVRFFGKS
jgi:hypothetical protein